MQKRRLAPVLALALLLPVAQAGGTTGRPMGPVSTAQVSNNSSVLFMEVMSMVNLEEVQTGQLALQKSRNAEVRAFAQMVITDHERAQAELRRLAARKGVRLTDKPGADQRLQYNHLATLSGAEFDAEYKKEQVSGHQTALELIKTYRSIGRDAQVLAYAAKTQPVIARHLEHAKMLP